MENQKSVAVVLEFSRYLSSFSPESITYANNCKTHHVKLHYITKANKCSTCYAFLIFNISTITQSSSADKRELTVSPSHLIIYEKGILGNPGRYLQTAILFLQEK